MGPRKMFKSQDEDCNSLGTSSQVRRREVILSCGWSTSDAATLIWPGLIAHRRSDKTQLLCPCYCSTAMLCISDAENRYRAFWCHLLCNANESSADWFSRRET